MFAQRSVESRDATRCNATTVAPFAWATLDNSTPWGCCCQGTSEAGRNIPPPVRATPARSAAGLAEPLGQLDAQLLLVVTDPRHVAVRPQQRRGHVQFGAFVDDVVDPI
jgi:hypothetical protein